MFLARRSLDLIRQPKLASVVSWNQDDARSFSLAALADPNTLLPLLATGTIVGGSIAFTVNRYRISKPDEYLTIENMNYFL